MRVKLMRLIISAYLLKNWKMPEAQTFLHIHHIFNNQMKYRFNQYIDVLLDFHFSKNFLQK